MSDELEQEPSRPRIRAISPEEMIRYLIDEEQELCAGLNRVLTEAGISMSGPEDFSYEQAFRQILWERNALRLRVSQLEDGRP